MARCFVKVSFSKGHMLVKCLLRAYLWATAPIYLFEKEKKKEEKKSQTKQDKTVLKKKKKKESCIQMGMGMKKTEE